MLSFYRNSSLPSLLLLLLMLSSEVYAQKALDSSVYPEDITVVDSLGVSADHVSEKLDKLSDRTQMALQSLQRLSDSTQQRLNRRTSPLDSLLAPNKHRLPALPEVLMPNVPTLPDISSQGFALPTLPVTLLESDNLKRAFSKGKSHQRTKAAQSKLKQGKQRVNSSATDPIKPDELSQLESYHKILPVDSLDNLSAVGDTLIVTAAQRGEAWATEQASEQLEGQLPDPLMAEHPQEDAMRSQLTEEARTFFGADEQKLNQAKAQLTKLKKTYRQVKQQDSVFIKNTSLAGVPTRDRLTYGLNINPDRTGLTAWQLRPQLGYQLNKAWVIGLGGLVQTKLIQEPVQINTLWKGGYGFVQRAVARQFLLYTELANETDFLSDERSEAVNGNWKARIGLGKQLAISDKLALQLLFLWEGLADRRTPMRDQFQIRVGVIRSKTL